MSFKTSPNRILVKDAAGRVTLDTNQPMPHILQTASVAKTVSFPVQTSGTKYSDSSAQYMFNYTPCAFENVCGFQNVCVWETRGGVYGYYCDNQYICEWKNVCTTKQAWRTEVHSVARTEYAAREWEQVQNLATITNGIDADFVQVRVEGSRTTAGVDPFYGTFVATLPSGHFLSQGSTILESSFLTGGSSWLRRIMSVYVEAGVVKVKFKSSSRLVEGPGSNSVKISETYDPPDSGFNGSWARPGAPYHSSASNFNFTFHVTIGKFTQ